MTSTDGGDQRPFTQVVCGVDGSTEAIEAARQACRLAPGRPVTLVAALDVLSEPARAAELPDHAHTLRERAADALDEAGRQLEADDVAVRLGTAIEEGHVADVLRYATGGDPDALLAIGARGDLLGGPAGPAGVAGAAYEARVALRTVREVSCSVLVARPARRPDDFPSSIVVGVDGSSIAADAYRVAASIAAASGASLRCVAATGGRGPDLDAVRAAVAGADLDLTPDHPVTALLAAASTADVLVLGHRGLHGLRALGSVSERVLAQARTSVLVVRRR